MKKIIMDYCLLHQMNTFGPKFFWFSCMGKKVPFWQFFRIFKNCQNGTFLPMDENQKFFGPNAFTWSAKKATFRDFIQNMSQAPSKCLKFIYSEKATKFCEISALLFSTVHADKSKVEISQNFVTFSEVHELKL